ncbi:MAG: Gfo/Idh/MocA family oxidoreductase [Marinosulfonomonas sp.]|nr:Gfo/Idh/MocA family oxidoreductase [Marinosulfonomonas sp.]
MKNESDIKAASYGLIGAAGYIAPRHLRAIKDTDGHLAAAFDTNDSVGIIDSFFPEAAFFTEFERFNSHVLNEQQDGRGIDYAAICSPNYLHKSHIAFALRAGAQAICEKPLVLNPSDINDLMALEKQTGNRVFSILQLRLHPSIIALRDKVAAGDPNEIYDVDLGYFTSRGAWYYASWKGFEQKSGGIATNIGVHFYDMLAFIFGPLQKTVVHHRGADAAAGYLEFRQARVRWVLSINCDHLPAHTPKGQTTHRSITVNGEEIEFSGGFTDLHTASFQHILNGKGFGLEDARPSIELVSAIRNAPIELGKGEQHPDLTKVLKS